MADTADLKERLRSFDCITMNGCGDELRAEAVDRIDALEAENERLRDKLNLERALTDGAHRRARAALKGNLND